MKTFLCMSLVIVILLSASPAFSGGWLIYHDSPYKGKVVNAETNEPIEGAAVVAVWYLERYGGLGGPVARFLNAKETITNKNGDFVIPSMFAFHWWPFASLDEPNVSIFKPGYSGTKIYRYRMSEGNIKLKKTRTREERIDSAGAAWLGVSYGRSNLSSIPANKIPNYLQMMEKEYKELGLSK